MRVPVRLFARARELAGLDLIEVELAHGTTVADLRQAVSKIMPPLANMLATSAVAINDEYAADDAVIPESAEVALIPPVSGGSC